MDYEDFVKSLQENHPPEGLNTLLQALWYDAKGNWEKSHEIASEIETKNGSWVHAYLHRKEGDLWNADYWYKRAGQQRSPVDLKKEWEDLVRTFL